MKDKNRIGRVVSPGVVDVIEQDHVKLKPNQVRIQIKASAICGSDLHIFKGMHPFCPLPATIGHEFAGDVVEVGSLVTRVQVGQRVTVEPCQTCGVCEECRSGHYNYCDQITFLYRIGSGSMADYIVAESDHVFELPHQLSYEAGSLIEPLAVATHAVRRADIRLGQSVIISGAGAIGVLIGALCKRSGASKVTVIDGNTFRLDLAKAFGATHTINFRTEDVEEQVKALTGPKGVDRTFECVGLQQTFIQSMMWLRKGGLATIVGIFEKPEIEIPATRFVSHEIRVQGTQGYCWDFPTAIEVAEDLQIERLISHRISMDHLQRALELSSDRNEDTMKVVLVNE